MVNKKLCKIYFEETKKNNIFLARDHGGPWQNQREIDSKISLSEAMKKSKISFEEDTNNFSLIHIDTSVSLKKMFLLMMQWKDYLNCMNIVIFLPKK